MEEQGSEGAEGSVDAEGPDGSDGSDVADAPGPDAGASDSDASDAWDSEGSEGAGWFADPDVEGQERYFDGSEWTSETRSAEPDAPVHHLPDHAGELQRALAAATADIDDVEDRLGTLFDRAEQVGERGGRAKQAAADHRAAKGQALADSLEQDPDGEAGGEGGAAAVGEADDFDDDDAFADLDEALASEEPEDGKGKKGLFRRRS